MGGEPPGADVVSAPAQGWFRPVPAYRLASFRVLLALSTLCFHLPTVEYRAAGYLAASFHEPVLGWLPVLPAGTGRELIVLMHVAAWALLVGVWPRTAAAFLAGASAWILLLDDLHYSHHYHFHVLLLALLACARDGLSLPQLLREDDGRRRCPAWSENLLRWQVAIVFLFTAIDKVFSPMWGLAGAELAMLRVKFHDLPLGWTRPLTTAVLRTAPGLVSAATIAVEALIAVGFVVPALAGAAAVLMVGFALALELVVEQGYFAWDLLIATVLVLPGDRAWAVVDRADCARCAVRRRLLAGLDWLRRLRWQPGACGHGAEGEEPIRAGARALRIVGPDGRSRGGFDALRLLSVLLPAPLLAGLTLIRALDVRLLGLVQGPDVALLGALALVALWLPGVAPLVGRLPFARLAGGSGGAGGGDAAGARGDGDRGG